MACYVDEFFDGYSQFLTVITDKMFLCLDNRTYLMSACLRSSTKILSYCIYFKGLLSILGVASRPTSELIISGIFYFHIFFLRSYIAVYKLYCNE